MGSSRNVSTDRKRRERKHTRARKSEIISEEQSRDLERKAIKNCGESNVTVQAKDTDDENSGGIMSEKKRLRKRNTENWKMNFDHVDDRRTSILNSCLDGGANDSTPKTTSGGRNVYDVCKPCSVVLKRLSSDELANISKVKKSSGIRSKKRFKCFNWNYQNYLRNKRLVNYERLMKKKALEEWQGIRNKEGANNEEGGNKNSGEKAESKNEFGTTDSRERVIGRGDSRSIENFESEMMTTEISEQKIIQNLLHPASARKNFKLSLKKGKSNTQNVCRKNSLTEDKSKDDKMSSQKSKKMIENSDKSNIVESVFFQNLLPPTSTPERFRLSLKKRKSNTEEACGKISLTGDRSEDEKMSNQKSKQDCSNQEKIQSSRKRNRSNVRSEEVVASKRRRCRITVSPTIDDSEKLITSDTIADELIPFERLDNVKIVASPETRTDENLKASVNSIIKNESPITKNLRVSIAKLFNSPEMPELELDDESNVEPLNCLINSCARTSIYQRKILRITPENAVANDTNKFRNKKITDYFMKIDKKSILPKDNVGTSNQVEMDLALKKKYGIIKKAVVSLVDLKEYKIHDMFKYLASEIEKLTYQNIGSSSTLNISVVPKSSPPSSPITSNHLSSAAPPEFPSIVNNCMKDASQEFLQTLQFPRIEMCTPTKSRSDSSNEDFTKNSIALESESGKESSNCENHVQNYSSVEKTPSKHFDSQSETRSLTELNPILNSILINDNESGDSSTVHRAINDTPKTLRNGRKRGSSLSPRKRRGLIVSEMEISLENDNSCVKKNINGDEKILETDLPSTQSQTSESVLKLYPLPTNDEESGNRSLVPSTNNDSSKTSEERTSNRKRSSLSLVRKCKRLIISDTEPSESQICGTKISNAVSEKVGKKDNDTSVVDKCLNMDPAFTSVMKSPLEKAKEKSELLKLLNRRLPLNTMTCLNSGVIDEHGSCLGLNETINDITEIDRAKNKETVTPECNDSKLACKKSPTKKIENNLLEKIESFVELKNKESDLGKSINLNEPVPENVKNYTSNENVSMTENNVTEKVVKDKKRQVPKTRGDEPSTSDVLILKKITLIEDYDKAVPVIFAKDYLGKSSPSEDPPTDPLQPEFINKSEVNADALTKEKDVIAEKLPACFSSSTVTAQVDEACENSEKIVDKECVMCKEKFGQIKDLEKHLHVHIKDTNSCILCDKSLTKENVMKHYLEHCSCAEDDSTFHECNICNRKFRKLSGIKHHLKSKHRINNKLYTLRLVNQQSNQCSICLKNCNSRDELSAHVYSHNGQELQNAYEMAKANQSVTTSPKAPAPQEKSTKTPIEENAKEPEKTTPKPTTSSDIPDTVPAATPSNCAVSICMCHKDERLQISGSVIIEVGLTCEQCKTFYKTRRCFKDHYNNTSCKWSEKTVVIPAMFCNKCCVILNSLQEMHIHLKQHTKSTSATKSSFLCKLCNVYFFGIGSLFYAHWFNHCDNPLFVADHSSFPVNFKVKIVEPEPMKPPNKDQLMENLLVAEHQCLECQEPFETEEDLKEHMILSHSCVKKVDSRLKATVKPKPLFKLICSICNKEFSDKPAFDAHVEEHDAIIDFLKVPKLLIESLKNDQRNCTVCDTEYETANIYKEHITRHDIIREKFVCNYCSLMVDSVEKFGRHALEHKGTPEKSVACKVIFATAKFHCKPCKIWFDDQAALDQHLATHDKRATSSKKSAESLPTNSAHSPTGKKNLVCVTSNQELSHQVDLVNSTSTQEKDNSVASVKVNPAQLQISDDTNSNLSEVGILAPDKPTEQRKEFSVENPSVQEKKESPIKKKDRPAFLRVKNLKELLPYSCSTCKMEFDTQLKLTNHICSKHDTLAQHPNFKYACTICKTYKCNNDADWNLHVLSHFPLSSTPRFNNSWFNVLSIQSDKPILKCNVCAKYGCVSVSMMRDHFINVHPDIYRPVYKCRVCRAFQTPIEQIIRRHEAAHFRNLSGTTPPPLIQTEKNSTSFQSVTGPSNSENVLANPPVSTAYPPNHRPSIPTTKSLTSNSQQSDLVQPFINFTDNLEHFQQSYSTNNFQQTAVVPSANSLGNNSTTLQQALLPYQPVENLNNKQQQSVLVAVGTNSVDNSLPFTSVNNAENSQQTVAVPLQNNSTNDMSSGQTVKTMQWAPPTKQILPDQIPTNNDPPFNNVTNVIKNTAPLQTVTNPMYFCSKCPNFKSTCEQQVKAHESLHEFIRLNKPVQKKYSCQICPDFVCNNAEQFAAHFFSVHKSNKRMNLPPLQPKPDSTVTRTMLKCKHCPQTFVSSAALAGHIYTSHTYFIVTQPGVRESTTMYPYACHSCSIRFSEESYLHTHLKEAHPEGKLNYIQNLFRCDMCQLYLTSQAALECHLKSHNVLYK